MIAWVSKYRAGLTYIILLGVGFLTVGYSLAAIGEESLTGREQNLLAVSLSLSSIFLSWVITTLYHNSGTTRSMRDKDVQRANLIQSVKRQLGLLRDWNKIQSIEQASSDHYSRLRSHSDHIHEVLLGIDCQFDAMLKEIGGNIGDADRQASELLSSVQEIGTKIQNLESEKQRIEARSAEAGSWGDYSILQERIAEITNQQESLKNEITSFLTSGEVGSSGSKIPNKLSQKEIECPYCNLDNVVLMSGFVGETRMHKCSSCSKYFNAHCTSRDSFISRPHIAANAVSFDSSDIFRVRLASISPPGFVFSPADFKLLSDTLIASYQPHQFSLKTLGDSLFNDLEDVGYTKSRVGKFLQLLYWTRLFDLEASEEIKPPSALLISNTEITRNDIAGAFFRSIGYRMASINLASQSEVERDITTFLKVAASDLDVGEMVDEYMSGRASAQPDEEAEPDPEL